MVRNGEIKPEQADDGADQALGLAQRQAEHGTSVRAVRIASAEYEGWPPRVVHGSACKAAIASAVNQTVGLPRLRRLAS